jgi:CheY-like chemotaxis protein
MKNGCTILHIEDDDVDHQLFARDLEKLRFEGRHMRASSFNEAKAVLTRCLAGGADCPDLIIADSKLGIYDGLDIVQWVKAQPRLRDVPVLVYSAAISPTQSQAVLEAGAVACLNKPIASDESLVALQIILNYLDRRCQKEK